MPRARRLGLADRIPADLAVDMDPHDFGEVMGNLLDNARKWARAQVTIRAERAGEKARIIVEDDGPGFPTPTARAPRTGRAGTADPTSSGLGLGIVEDILAEYGTSRRSTATGIAGSRSRSRSAASLPMPVDSKPGSRRERPDSVSSLQGIVTRASSVRPGSINSQINCYSGGVKTGARDAPHALKWRAKLLKLICLRFVAVLSGPP